jgi:hypothetical protein
LKHSIEWQDDAENASLEERATVADLRLFVNRLNVTQHFIAGETSDHVTAALYGLAHGISHRWWTIFGSRDQEISLTSFRSGYLLPDVRLRFDGAALEVSACQKVYEGPDVRFWGGPSEVLSRRDGETWLTELVTEVLDRLKAKGVEDTSAALRWKRVQLSRHSDERAFCEAAGGLGLDPYAITDDTAAFIERAEELFGEDEPLVEFVVGAGGVDQTRLIRWVDRMARSEAYKYRLADLRDVVDAAVRAKPSQNGEQAWAAGYRRASVIRNSLGLSQADRFGSFKDIAKKFGGGATYDLAPKVDGIKALRREHPNGVHVHLRNHGDSPEAKTAHLFAIARAVGDVACFPAPHTAPINTLRHAYRQAAGRAFAAEFLAPIDEIDAMLEDKRDIISIANEFSVSPAVIQHQIENKARIAQACAA